jgi:hypothetical protein
MMKRKTMMMKTRLLIYWEMMQPLRMGTQADWKRCNRQITSQRHRL